MSVKAGQPIIDALNEILKGELAAINQYFLHARICDNWGLKRLGKKLYDESIDEMRHADQLIERILYLDGIPSMQEIGRIRIGEDVREVLTCDMALEHEAIPRLNDAIALCRDSGDNGTRALLEAILVSEEEHLDWIESQLHIIDTFGVAHYASQQIGGN